MAMRAEIEDVLVQHVNAEGWFEGVVESVA